MVCAGPENTGRFMSVPSNQGHACSSDVFYQTIHPHLDRFCIIMYLLDILCGKDIILRALPEICHVCSRTVQDIPCLALLRQDMRTSRLFLGTEVVYVQNIVADSKFCDVTIVFECTYTTHSCFD